MSYLFKCKVRVTFLFNSRPSPKGIFQMIDSCYFYVFEKKLVIDWPLDELFLENIWAIFLVSIPKHSQMLFFSNKTYSFAPSTYNPP